MGLIHTPRVIHSIAKGLWKGRTAAAAATAAGSSEETSNRSSLGWTRPHQYKGQVGLFDVDYLGHLNNAAYLNHAELARWQWMTEAGTFAACYRHKLHFLASGATVRYRKEIRPLWKEFCIDTQVVGMDESAMFLMQQFRYPPPADTRVLAQFILKTVVVQRRKVLNPRDAMVDLIGLDADLVDEKFILSKKVGNQMEEMIQHFVDLDGSMKAAASLDDKQQQASQE